MPVTRFAIRHIPVENFFALTHSNVVDVECDVGAVHRDVHRFRLTGVGAFVIEHGRVRSVKDYIFRRSMLERMFAPENAATPSIAAG